MYYYLEIKKKGINLCYFIVVKYIFFKITNFMIKYS